MHLQILGRRVKPITCFDQSLTFPRSNVLTPFSTAMMISSLDFLKAFCRSCVQTKSVLGFIRYLKGSMTSDWEKAKLHWLTRT